MVPIEWRYENNHNVQKVVKFSETKKQMLLYLQYIQLCSVSAINVNEFCFDLYYSNYKRVLILMHFFTVSVKIVRFQCLFAIDMNMYACCNCEYYSFLHWFCNNCKHFGSVDILIFYRKCEYFWIFVFLQSMIIFFDLNVCCGRCNADINRISFVFTAKKNIF